MDVAGAVVAHRLQIRVFEKVEGLQHDRTLNPGLEFVHLQSFVGRHDRFFYVDLPVRQVLERVQASLFTRTPDEFLGDVAPVEAVIGGQDCSLAILSGGQGLLLGLDQFFESLQQVRLPKYLSGVGRLPLFVSQMWQQDVPGVGPLFDFLFLALDVVGLGALNGVAGRHLHGWSQHFLQR